jgi:two-component sensor histidine kinase
MLREIYLATDNYKGAYAILMDQKIMEDSLRNSEILSKIADYEVKYQTQQKELELQQTAANKKILTSLLWAGGIVLLLVLYFLYKNRQKNKKLAKQKQLLETTLDEKNVLLKEIHHRVKNSFQIVSSLLYLQSESIDDKEAQLAIKEAQNRVRSMVLIHQKLYNKDQLVGINTKEYFEDLTRDIFESHQFSNKPIRYATDIKPMVLDIETITPIGLILNELITNVLKHAFPEVDDQSEMQLRFDKKGDALVLELQDNGQGMPEEVAESSFGIKLMKALSKKLKADLTFKPGPKQGTLASLEITKFNLLG